VALQLLLNDKYKLESLQEDGSRTRQKIPQTAGCKARACNCCYFGGLPVIEVQFFPKFSHGRLSDILFFLKVSHQKLKILSRLPFMT